MKQWLEGEWRVLVTGSRTWDKPDVIFRALDYAYHTMPKDADYLCLVHGDCPTGADQIAHEWYLASRKLERKVDEDPYPADWEMYGKTAGLKRNKQMVEAGANLCLAFSRAGSRGTRHCASLARRNGIPLVTFAYEKIAEGA